MLPTTKLTKRQKKGIAFRERKHGKDTKAKVTVDVNDLENEKDVDNVEDQALPDASQSPKGGQDSPEPVIRKRKRQQEGEKSEGWTKKRKSKVEEEKGASGDKSGEPEQPKSKRRKGVDRDPVVDMEQPVEGLEDEDGRGKTTDKSKQRFILFLGNLKYTTTIEAIQGHFSTCDPPPTVRLLTPKPLATKSPKKPVTKSKGCAFLEFKHQNALQQGLKFHHSQLDGRQINVELTAGGGGKGEARMNKLKERNKGLEGQRRKRQERDSDNSAVKAPPPGGAKRFSATSGTGQVPTHEETWTVGDTEETETRRGGERHQRSAKKRKSRVKDFGTGVNAIPVG